MSASNNIGSSFTIIPQSVHKILTDATFDGKEVRANNESVFKGTFAEKQGTVLNDLKRLSYARKVTWNDTGGQTGFSGFLKVVGNILHNFRSHFYSSEKALADLKRDVQTLEKFGTSEKMTASEYKQLEGFLTEIKQINKDNEVSLQNWKKNISECLGKYNVGNNFDAETQGLRMKNLNALIDLIPGGDECNVRLCVDMFELFTPSPSSEETEKLRGLFTNGKTINKKDTRSLQEWKAEISKCLERFKPGNIAMQQASMANLKSMIDLSYEGDDNKCLEIFKGFEPSPSEEEINNFKQFLTDGWHRNSSLGDRLEQILEEQAKVYEGLHNIPKNA